MQERNEWNWPSEFWEGDIIPPPPAEFKYDVKRLYKMKQQRIVYVFDFSILKKHAKSESIEMIMSLKPNLHESKIDWN